MVMQCVPLSAPFEILMRGGKNKFEHLGFEPMMTLEEVAEKLGIHRVTAQRLEKSALIKLRLKMIALRLKYNDIARD